MRSGRRLLRWLEEQHPDVSERLYNGASRGDADYVEALDSPSALVAWVERHCPELIEEWKTSEEGQ